MGSPGSGRTRGLFRLSWHLAIVLSVAALAWRFIDFAEVGRTLAGVQWPWLVGLLGLASADRWLMALKWLHLLRAGDLRIPFATTLSAYYQASFMQRLLPSSLGGDALRAAIVAGRHAGGSWVLVTMVMEKVLALLAAMLLAIVGLVWASANQPLLEFEHLAIALGGALAALLLALVVSMRSPVLDRVVTLVPGRRLQRLLSGLYGAYRRFASRGWLLAGNFGLCVTEQVLQVVLLVACGLALGVEASVATLAAAIAISQCLRKVAILLEGWVLGEFTNVVVCTLMGIPEAQALSFSLLGHMVGLVAAAPGLLLFLRSAVRLSHLRALRMRLESSDQGDVAMPAAAAAEVRARPLESSRIGEN